MTCTIWIPGPSGTWVRLAHPSADGFDFARLPSVGEFILEHQGGQHYEVKLVTQITPDGTAPAILHAVPIVWADMLRKAHPDVQSASLAGQP